MSDLSYHKVRNAAVAPPDGCPVDHEFSPYSPRYIANPYAWLQQKRENEPVFYSEELQYLVVTRMEDVEEVFMNSEVFSSENVQNPVFSICDEAAEILAAEDYNPVAVMSNRQQPDHTRIRKYTQAGFSGRRMRVLEPIIRQRTEDLIDGMLAAGPPVEWVGAVGNPLTAETIFRLLGFPEKDDEQVKAWTNNRLEFTWGKTDKETQIQVAKSLLAYWRYVVDYVEMRRADPADDFTSELLAAHAENPDDLGYNEVQSVVYGLSFAGHEIVRNLISNALLCLLGERHNWTALCDDPSRIKDAIEEVLRFNSAQTSWRRVTTRDTEFRGYKLPKGTQVFLSLASANHDPRLFDNPERFDMDRANLRKHIAFGRGIHICLGRLLAKLEVRIVLELLTRKVPSLRLVIGQEQTFYPNFSFRGPKTLYLAWDE
ncbi:MAG: cytochrome P450 [Gammaproteobacteria bacterium]|nr:cytochrome P450 [Gammaproteobacteria bacterium]